MEQHKITNPGKLLNPDGTLRESGYATKLILEYNRENIKHGWHRIKEWDYYAILAEEFGIALTVADLGLFGLLNVTWLDFKNRKYETLEDIQLFTRGKWNLPRTSETGDIHIKRKKIDIEIRKEKEIRKIYVKAPSFIYRPKHISDNRDENDPKGLEAEITLLQPADMDTMVIASSWKEKRTAFYYNQKVNCMEASGIVKIGQETFEFGTQNNSFGVLDWGRGVWTYKNRWYWSSLSKRLPDGHIFGWNLGYGFSDRSAASENMLFYDGRAHKLEDVEFMIPERSYLDPWRITSSDGRLEASFTPILDRSSDTNLIIFRSIQHQVFGRFSGTAILDDGSEIKFKNLLGFAEKVTNRW